MIRLVRIAVAIALCGIIAVLLASSLGGGPLHGNTLMFHMMVSGAMVFSLPVFALVWLPQMLDFEYRGLVLRAGFWLLLATGFVTIATMFVSMLPIAGTDDLHQLISIHGYAGFVCVAATALFAVGWIFSYKKSIR
jgi:heme/copper-type cytochrome/quinol oxidase subunit 1